MTENLSAEDSEPFMACPHCLNEVVPPQIKVQAEEEHEPEDNISAIPEDMPRIEKQSNEPPAKSGSCRHHLGYLSERSKKEAIPEECIVCEHIVKCMLRAITG